MRVEGKLDKNGILTMKAVDVVSGTSSRASINVTSHFSMNADEIRLATERLEQLEQMYAEVEMKTSLKENLQTLCDDVTSLVKEEPNIPEQHANAVENECQNIQKWLDGTKIQTEPLSELNCRFTNLKRTISTSVGVIVEKKFIQMANMLGHDWWCGSCSEYNYANNTKCTNCKVAKQPCE